MPRRAAEGIELLADPTRRQIIALIADRVWHPADIADALKLSRPAISRQLRLLMDGGLIRRRRSALDLRSREYFIDPSMQPAIIAWLAGVDLRNVRPICRPDWSPPPRVHRQRRDVQALGLEHGGFGWSEPSWIRARRRRRSRMRMQGQPRDPGDPGDPGNGGDLGDPGCLGNPGDIP